jgi:hypothetical protein
MWIDVSERGTVGYILREDFEALPDSIRNEFLDTILIKNYGDDTVEFPVDSEKSEQFCERIKAYFLNRKRSEIRKHNLRLLSGGMYEKEDIDRLFEIQEGRCYYTGERLTRNPKNYSIDHIVPVAEGGSSWPGNLALVTVDANQEKHDQSKRKMFAILEARYGKEWQLNQRELCKRVDSRRRVVDKARKRAVSNHIDNLLARLIESFPDADLDYRLKGDVAALSINDTEVTFAAGFMRQKKLFGSFDYLKRITMAILSEKR